MPTMVVTVNRKTRWFLDAHTHTKRAKIRKHSLVHNLHNITSFFLFSSAKYVRFARNKSKPHNKDEQDNNNKIFKVFHLILFLPPSGSPRG